MKENTVTTFAKLFVGAMLALILLLAAFGVGVGVGIGQGRTQIAAAVPESAVELAEQEAPAVVSTPAPPEDTPSPAKQAPTAQMTASPTPPRAIVPTPTRQDKAALPDDVPLDLALINESWKLLKEQFYGNLPEGEEVTYAAIRGIVESLNDKHTAFLNPQQAEAFNIDVQGQFEGIGARVDVAVGGGVQIKHLFADQPAQKAGLQVDDIVIEVDGIDVTSMQLDAAVALIRGPRGTQVRLKVIRNGAEPFEVTITRARIEIPVITTQTLGDGTIEYIALSEFSSVAAERTQDAVRTAVGRKPKGIILDLRDNPGGLLDASVRIGSYFVPEGNILIERFADGRQQEYKRQGRYLLNDIPLVVLVNGGSASASEIVAGAIQDAGVGVLIGTQTYGKGSVQLPNSMSDGSQLRVTIARWYTPKDRGIDETGLTPDIESPDPTAVEIDLSSLEPYINGPFSPDIATPISKMKETAARNNWPVKISVGLIGSCTNSSYEDISRAASVVKDAAGKNLIIKSEFTITPGSEQIRSIAERDGYLKLFESIGGKVFANACGPCIGQWDREGADKKEVNTVIHSFNRNFAKRTDGNPNTHAFVASPEIVTALAIAGDLTFNPLKDELVNSQGKKVKLSEPQGFDLPPGGFGQSSAGLQKPSGDNTQVEIKIRPGSDRLQALEPFPGWDGKDLVSMNLLIKARGKCTTDHISMAGVWLKYRGHLDNISDNYMIGAVNAFNNQTNSVLNHLSRKYEAVPAVARQYKKAGIGSFVAGEENFGEGSSREHAAMEPRFLNVKAVMVKSFARIHETNLKKQGVLALTFADKADYDKIREDDKIDIKGMSGFAPGRQLTVVLSHSDGTTETIKADHSYNEVQIDWFRAGGALNLIREKGRRK